VAGLTGAAMSDKAPQISLPQGGGAIQGIGELFQPDPQTGTAHLSVPLQLSPGRNGFQPSLTLAYDSGQGNGPFGVGWGLSVPSVRRRTSKGVPRYVDSDTFVLSGAEDLMPVAGVVAGRQRFRPRVEGMFARIEHVVGAEGDYWQVWTGDGHRSTYGTPRPSTAPPDWRDPAVICDPADPGRVFGWLISETGDSTGNLIRYAYESDPDLPGCAQRYLAEIGYADVGDATHPTFAIRVVFTYQPRPDAVRDRRAGFEIRTARRCTQIDTLIQPPQVQSPQTESPILSRSVFLDYRQAPGNGASLLAAVRIQGRDGSATQDLPPLEFAYSEFHPETRRYTNLAGALPNAPLSGPDIELVDLFGFGLPSVLEINGTTRYWRNCGDGRLADPRSMRLVPTGVALSGTGVQLADMTGDGRPDLVVTRGPLPGYFPMSADGGFDQKGFTPYRSAPAVNLDDPAVKLVDLDGDGVIDALRSGESLQAYYNRPPDSWDGPVPVRGPEVALQDPRVRLADMTGDGLTDLVLVHDGNLSYWPYCGWGHWDQPVAMANAPRFADPGYGAAGFDPRRLLIGDVDGDGCADVVYVADDTVTVWLNQGGGGFADPVVIHGTPPVDDVDAVRLADMLGCGTAGVLWSYAAGRVRGGNYTFLDLTGGTKPYLLTVLDNHRGARTTIEYAASTLFALADQDAGRPWATTLPFPVQVVSTTRLTDHFSGTTLTSQYSYHHGYWDGTDREFRGFGRVDRRDVVRGGPTSSAPTETRSWFHLGPVGPEFGAWIDLDHSAEYWSGDPPLAGHLDLDGLPGTVPRRVLRDAVRAARRTLLRQELYGLDGTPGQARPYEITDHAVAIAPVLDGRGTDRQDWQDHPVFALRATLTRSSVWERGADPMIHIQVTGGYDDYGRPASVIDIGVPRGHDPRRGDGSDPYLATLTTTAHATRDDEARYVTDRVVSSRRDELTATSAVAALDLAAAALAGTTARNLRALTLTYYDGPPAAGPGVPPDALGGLPLGQIGDAGLPTRVETLAVTPDQLAVLGAPAYLPADGTSVPASAFPPDRYPSAFAQALPPLAGYTWHPDGAGHVAGYYVQSRRQAYDTRGLVTASRDALGNDTVVEYEPCGLLPRSVTDPLGLTHSAEYDYRVLSPSVATDPNGNRTQAGYTPLGFLAWTAATGRIGANQGDTAEQPGIAYSYILTAWDDSAGAAQRQPMAVRTTRRILHRWTTIDEANATRAADGQPPLTDAEIAALFPANEAEQYPERFIQDVEYSDGLSRLLQKRTQADTIVLDDLGLTADQTGRSPLPAPTASIPLRRPRSR
jgi:YD repeat-containing protein